MAQVKKLQEGGTVAPGLTFKVNGKEYKKDKQFLQDMFNPVFDDMVKAGVAKERNRDDFYKSFQQYTSQAENGVYNINSSAGKLLDSGYKGPAGANLGLDDDGESAKKTGVGNVISPFKRNEEQTMSMLSTYLGDRIIKSFDGDEATNKAKLVADEAKLKADKLKGQDDQIGKFGTYKNPFTAIYGKDGENASFATKQYWDHSDRIGRAQGLNKGLKGFADYVFDNQFNDVELQKKFSESTGGYDITKIRERLTRAGYKDGKFAKDLGVEELSQVLDDVDLRSAWDGAIRRPVVEKTPVALTSEQQAAADKQKALDDAAAKAKAEGITLGADGVTPLEGVVDRLRYKGGKLFSGVYAPDKGEYSTEDAETGFFVNGKMDTEQAMWDNLKSTGNADLISSTQAVLKAIRETQKGYTDDPNGDQSAMTADNTSDKYAFKDLMGKAKNPVEISNLFKNLFDDENVRLYKYTADGRDRLGGQGLVRYRYIKSNGQKIDGALKKEMDGKHYIIDSRTGQRHEIGYENPVNDKDGKPLVRKDPYYIPVRKLGGILKAQLGTSLKNVAQQKGEFKSADINGQVVGGSWDGLSSVDRTQIYALGADLGGLAAGFVPGGSLVGAGAGIAGTGMNAWADYKRDGNFSGGDALSLAGGLALDVATAIPGFGQSAKYAKIAMGIRKSSKVLASLFAGAGMYAAAKSLGKFTSDEKIEVDDWKNIAAGLQGVVGAKRMTDKYVATKSGGSIDQIKVDGKYVNIPSAAATKIRTAKPEMQAEIAKRELADIDGLDVNKIDFTDLARKHKIAFGLVKTPFKSKDVDAVPSLKTESASGRQLIDYKDANWYQKLSVRNTVAQNPGIKGAEKFTIGKGGPRANEVEGGANKWLGNSYKMQYDPKGEFKANFRDGSARQLGPASGKPQMGITQENTVPKNVEGPNAAKAASDVKLATKRKMESVTDARLKVQADKKTEKRVTQLTDLKNKQEQTKVAQEESQKQAKLADVQNRVGQLQQLKLNQQEAAVKLQRKEKLAASKIKKQQAQVEAQNVSLREQAKAQFAAQNKNNGLRMKSGKSNKKRYFEGGILKADSGLKLPFAKVQYRTQVDALNGDIMGTYAPPTPLNLDRFNLKPLQFGKTAAPMTTMTGDRNGFAGSLPGVNLNLNLPKFETPEAQKARWVAEGQHNLVAKDKLGRNMLSEIGKINGTKVTSNKEADYGNSGIDLPSLKGINANTLSEFGRALYTRHLNSQIDTRVERPMLQAPAEVALGIRGNLSAKTAMDSQANDVIQRSNVATSDGMLHTAAALQGNAQAAQLRGQGDMLNIEALERSRAQANEQSMKYGEARSNVANQNMQTLARATQAERAAGNEKFARMNQPMVDFWKDQNYKSQVQERQNEGLDMQIALTGKEGEFATATKPLTSELDTNQMRLAALQTKSYSAALTPAEIAESERLTARNTAINESLMDMQNKAKLNLLQTRKNVNYTTPKGYYKDGGQVRLRVEETKQESTTDREIVKTHAKFLDSNSDDEAKRQTQAMRQIQELIKLALS